ncbi:MAG: hypothetical protein ACFB51_05655 [Anaerolineae bacterium]
MIAVVVILLASSPLIFNLGAPAGTDTCRWEGEVSTWIDADGSGTRDEGERPLRDVRIVLESEYEAPFQRYDWLTGSSGRAPLRTVVLCTPDGTPEGTLVITPPPGFSPAEPVRLPLTAIDGPLTFGYR